MNPVLKYLGTSGKDLIAKIVSVEEQDYRLPDDIIFLADLAYPGPNGTTLAADVYRPYDASADPLPIAVFVHGGGLFVGSRKANRAYAALLAKQGYVVFVPEYRLIDKTDGIGAIADVCAGYSYLKTIADALGGDPERILVIGESAGGFLTLYATALLKSFQLQTSFGIKAPDLSVRGLALFGGMLYTDCFDPIGLVYRRDMYGKRLRDENFRELLDPEHPRVESNLPPVMLVSSRADFLKSYTLRYSRALAMAGHDHRLIFYRKGKDLVHAFPSLHPELPESEEVLNRLDAWFKSL